jgi:hypothetical protein
VPGLVRINHWVCRVKVAPGRQVGVVTLFQAGRVGESAGHAEGVGMGNLGDTIMMIGVFVALALVVRAIQYWADRHGWGAADPGARSVRSRGDS